MPERPYPPRRVTRRRRRSNWPDWPNWVYYLVAFGLTLLTVPLYARIFGA